MKLVLAMMKHETNTFSPVPTTRTSFGGGAPRFGEEARQAFRGTATPIGAFIELAESAGAEIVTPVAAEALPSGIVEAAAYEEIVGAILDAVRDGCDGILLDLHGAMVTAETDDGEGALLERLRAIAPETPIGVALDLHTNLTARMVANCTALVGYKTYPHVDTYEAGRHVARILLRALGGEVHPVMAWGNSPLLAATLCMGTDAGPMRRLVDAAREAEARGDVLAATVFGGFPLADIKDAGLSVAVVADGDLARAEAERDRLLALAWKERQNFVYHAEPLDQSIARAAALPEGPVLLIDHADNCASGGTQDTMAVVAEVMRQGLEDVAVGCIRDPEAVGAMIAAGVGAEVTLDLGGKVDMPAIRQPGKPIEVSGRVRAISDGEFIIRGPMYTGVRAYMGRTAVLDAGKITFVVTERNCEPWDLGVFTSVGIDPTTRKYLLLKSRVHYRAAFLPIAKAVVECNGVGVTSSDLNLFPFSKLRRPIYPLDGDAAQPAGAVP